MVSFQLVRTFSEKDFVVHSRDYSHFSIVLWRFVSVASHKIRLQIEKSPFPDTVPGLHHKKPAEVRLDKKDVIMRLKTE